MIDRITTSSPFTKYARTYVDWNGNIRTIVFKTKEGL